MKKTRNVLLVFFLITLELGTRTISASDDPVESDTFRFTWLGIPIGEVTIHYGSYEDPKRARVLDSTTLISADVNELEREPRKLADGEHEDRKSMRSLRLGALQGGTNGLVRWLKRYEGAYTTTLTPGGNRYEVTAMDQGVPEVRDIWFGAKSSAIPQVLGFQDRSRADPLQPLVGVDEGSVDPVRLMALILKAIESHNGCSALPEFYRVFDGKRRYEARLSEPNWEDTSGLSEQGVSTVALESSSNGGRSSIGGGIPSSSRVRASDNDAASQSSAESTLDPDSRGEGIGDQDRHQLMLTGIVTSVSPGREGLLDRDLGNPAPRTVACRLTLVARNAQKVGSNNFMHLDVSVDGNLMPASPPGQTALNSIAPQGQGRVSDEIAAWSGLTDPSLSRGAAETRSSARETEYEKGQQGQDLISQQGLFWPFNRRDLTVDFSVSLNGTNARFRSFQIRGPVGPIKGSLVNKE